MSAHVIRAALLQAGIRSRPVSEHRGPGLTLYRLSVPPAAMPRAARMAGPISAALDCQGVTVGQRGALLEVCRPVAQPGAVSLSRLGPWLGVEASGRPVAVTLDRHRPHAIVGGQTGSGKSELLRSLALLQSRVQGTRLVLVDLKASGMWQELADRGHLVASDNTAARQALAWAASRIGSGEGGRVVVIIDEAARLDAPTRALALEIAERGRADEVHLVLATQYIRADVLCRRITTAADWRIAGRVFDGQASRLILGQGGAEHLTGRGDMLLVAGGAPAVRFRAAMADAAAWDHAVGAAGGTIELSDADSPASDDMLAWAAETRASARAIRMRYGVGQDKARRIRDEAAGMTDRIPTVIRPDFAARVTGQSVSQGLG